MAHRTGCLVCGEELVYDKAQKGSVCFFCHEEQRSEAICRKGHFVCDACHSLGAMDLIERYCSSSDSKDPLEMALTLMRNPAFNMHGPEHHFLVPAVLLCAYFNIKGDNLAKLEKVRTARERAMRVLGGFCGFYGDCGAAVGTGIFVSLITNATPLSKKEWRLSNLMTATSLRTIANNGGPRCCKRNTYLAIIEATRFVKKELGTAIPIRKKLKCNFHPMNKECRKEDCRFYGP